jgi:hypothetical protein
MTNLSDWSEVIRRQGEEYAEREAERLRVMKEDLPKQKAKCVDMTDEELLEYFCEMPRSDHDPRIAVLWQELFLHIKAELLNRLSHEGCL